MQSSHVRTRSKAIPANPVEFKEGFHRAAAGGDTAIGERSGVDQALRSLRARHLRSAAETSCLCQSITIPKYLTYSTTECTDIVKPASEPDRANRVPEVKLQNEPDEGSCFH